MTRVNKIGQYNSMSSISQKINMRSHQQPTMVEILCVCCRRLLLDGSKIFKEIQNYLLSYKQNNPDCCPDGEITLTCDLHGQICGALDSLSSILRIKYSKPQQEDYKKAEMALKNLDYLWSTAQLAKTPKCEYTLRIYSKCTYVVEFK